jgi:hypothetical protein
MEGHSPLSIDSLPDRTAQVVEFLCLRWNTPSASIRNQSDTFGKPMDRKVVTNQLTYWLRFLFPRKAFDNLLSGPDRTRGSKFEEFVSEQPRQFVWGRADFRTLKFHFQIAQQGALLIELHLWFPRSVGMHCRLSPYQHRMSQSSTASLRAGHRLAQNFCNIWMMGRRSSLLRRLVMHVSQREIGPFGNE